MTTTTVKELGEMLDDVLHLLQSGGSGDHAADEGLITRARELVWASQEDTPPAFDPEREQHEYAVDKPKES